MISQIYGVFRSRARSGWHSLVSFLPILCILSFSEIALAQSAALTGMVMDPSGAMVPKAQVILTNTDTNAAIQGTTNKDGFYSLPYVKPGQYTLTVEAPGFKTYERTGITIETAQTIAIDVKLQIGGMAQSVTVDGSGNNINTTDASVSTLIDRQFVENIPLNGRSFQSLMTMIPGVSVVPSNGVGQGGEITVNGERTEANYFTVDGVTANTGVQTTAQGWGAGYSGTIPGETALGTTQSIVSVDALQEFRATTSTYSAEYGRTPGGQFTFQTRSGTNDWYGTLFNYFRNDALDANNYFNKRTTPITPRQPERQNDFGGTLGGPLHIPGLYNGKDQTFFFFAYEGMRLRIPQAVTVSQVPTLELRNEAPTEIQPFLNSFPKPTLGGQDHGNGLADFIGGYSAPSSLDTSSIRIDHHFGEKFLIFGRYSDAPSDTQVRQTGAMSLINIQSVDAKTLTLGATNIFSRSFTSDLRLNFTRNRGQSVQSMDNYGGAVPLTNDFLNSTAGYPSGHSFEFLLNYGFDPGLNFAPAINTQHQINIVETMNAAIGRHNLKWGIDYRRLLTIGSNPELRQQGVYYTEDAVVNNAPTIYGYRGPSGLKPVYSNLSAFIQDEWRVSSRLSLSYGVRWELNPAPKDADGNNPYAITSTDLATVQVAPPNTPLWHTTYNNFAPRFGMAYQLHQNPGWETVLRSGVGIFYDTGNTNYASVGYGGEGMTSSATFTEPFPATQGDLDSIPMPSVTIPYTGQVYGFDPHLKLPYSWHWNFAVEQALGAKQTLTMSYVGSAGRRLLSSLYYSPPASQNPYFAGDGIDITTNSSTSDYDALQVQFQRKLSRGLQVLAGYTWSHAIDDLTTNFQSFGILRSSSDNDIRHNFQLGLSYALPGSYTNRVESGLLSGWSLDTRISARSALPVDILSGWNFTPSGSLIAYRPDPVRGQSLYAHDASIPGGRAINYDAFTTPMDADGNWLEGTLGRNTARAFAASQIDFAMNRNFSLTEKLGLQFRVEAFNLFNQPIMGSIYNALSYGDGMFGYAYNTQNNQLSGLSSLYQVGGPRSLQLALKLHF